MKLTEGFYFFCASLLRWRIIILWSPFRNCKGLWHIPNEEKCISQANSCCPSLKWQHCEAWFHIIFFFLVKTETPCFPHKKALVLVSSNRLERILSKVTSITFFFRDTFSRSFVMKWKENMKLFSIQRGSLAFYQTSSNMKLHFRKHFTYLR